MPCLFLLPLLITVGTAAAAQNNPWGVYDGNGGMFDGHYCADDDAIPDVNYEFGRGYWHGLTWHASNPGPGVFNFSALDALLAHADRHDRYVEANALVGQCSPTWLYTHGVEALVVNWKPPPTCVPPTCVPAGTWNCSGNNGQGCGCDGRTPCNQTFPDYLSPVYQRHQEEWAQALHDHLMALPHNLFRRLLSLQVNAGSTGDDTAWHGRLYPSQRLAGYNKIEDKAVYAAFSLKVHAMWIRVFDPTAYPTNTNSSSSNNNNKTTRAVVLLFNGLDGRAGATLSGLQQMVDKAVKQGQMPHGYHVKAGGPSHQYAESSEMIAYNILGQRLRTPLSSGYYVRSRGEATLSAYVSWMTNDAWTAWALAGWNLAYGTDTWQNLSLVETQPRLRPALSLYSQYAGWRPETASDWPGAVAILRDGLDTNDTQRFPEATFGPTENGKNYARCQKVLDSLQNDTRFPPRNDAASDNGCGCVRNYPKLGLNDACFEVWPGNYGALLEQIAPLETSVGAWRAGPKDEIFGRYGRMAKGGEMAFRTLYNVFGDAERGKTAFARVVYLADTGKAGKFELKYSTSGGHCVSAGSVRAEGHNASNAGHWVEARFELPDADLGAIAPTGCRTQGGARANLVVETAAAAHKPTVFSTVEVSKTAWGFDLSPWKTEADK